jgi:hypothetical protein
MRHRVVLRVTLFILLLLGPVMAAQSQEVPVDDPKQFAGQWFGRATLHGTTLPTQLSIREDGTYSGHVGNRPVAGVIRIVGRETRYEGVAIQGRLALYQGRNKRYLRAWADSGETFEYEERK